MMKPARQWISISYEPGRKLRYAVERVEDGRFHDFESNSWVGAAASPAVVFHTTAHERRPGDYTAALPDLAPAHRYCVHFGDEQTQELVRRQLIDADARSIEWPIDGSLIRRPALHDEEIRKPVQARGNFSARMRRRIRHDEEIRKPVQAPSPMGDPYFSPGLSEGGSRSPSQIAIIYDTSRSYAVDGQKFRSARTPGMIGRTGWAIGHDTHPLFPWKCSLHALQLRNC